MVKQLSFKPCINFYRTFEKVALSFCTQTIWFDFTDMPTHILIGQKSGHLLFHLSKFHTRANIVAFSLCKYSLPVCKDAMTLTSLKKKKNLNTLQIGS